jgi:hypothetical protein
MASELKLSASLKWEDAFGLEFGLEVLNFVKTITTKKPVLMTQTIGTSEEAIDLGDITPVYGFFKNRDATNFISIRAGTGLGNFARLDKDENGDGKAFPLIVRFGSGMTAPYAIADTAECQMVYLLIPA